jgi:hypothetical protein
MITVKRDNTDFPLVSKLSEFELEDQKQYEIFISDVIVLG